MVSEEVFNIVSISMNMGKSEMARSTTLAKSPHGIVTDVVVELDGMEGSSRALFRGRSIDLRVKESIVVNEGDMAARCRTITFCMKAEGTRRE